MTDEEREQRTQERAKRLAKAEAEAAARKVAQDEEAKEFAAAQAKVDARDTFNRVAHLAERLCLASVRGGERFDAPNLAEVSFRRAEAFEKERAAREARLGEGEKGGGT